MHTASNDESAWPKPGRGAAASEPWADRSELADWPALSADERQHRREVIRQFAAFYKANVARLVAYLITCGASPAEAADCAQETMIRVYQNWPRVREPYAWCRQVGQRLYFRRTMGVERPFEELPAAGEPLLQQDHGLDEVIVQHRLAAVLQALPLKQRQVMAMTYQGDTPSEIAAQLGATVDQVRSNLRLARQKVRGVLQDDDRVEGGVNNG